MIGRSCAVFLMDFSSGRGMSWLGVPVTVHLVYCYSYVFLCFTSTCMSQPATQRSGHGRQCFAVINRARYLSVATAWQVCHTLHYISHPCIWRPITGRSVSEYCIKVWWCLLLFVCTWIPVSWACKCHLVFRTKNHNSRNSANALCMLQKTQKHKINLSHEQLTNIWVNKNSSI